MGRLPIENRMRELRFQRDRMTQQELADRLGVTRQTVIAIEAGRYSPTLELAFKVAEVFEVGLDEVFQYVPRGRPPARRRRP
jgi:putative transcriptional regulator